MPVMQNEMTQTVAGGADLTPPLWAQLRRFTPARIAIGRTGGSQRTNSLLEFRREHALARDAVLAPFDAAAVATQLDAAGIAHEHLATAVNDRDTFLVRPDLGRRLDAASLQKLRTAAGTWGRRDLVLIISDGLASAAAERYAADVAGALFKELTAAGWTLYPVFIVPFGRVKLQDEIGEVLGAAYSLMLLGERPGLGVTDSLGAYFTRAPTAERTDADRNCISNIRADGFPPAGAARKIAVLLRESLRLGVGGTALKDTGDVFLSAGG